MAGLHFTPTKWIALAVVVAAQLDEGPETP